MPRAKQAVDIVTGRSAENRRLYVDTRKPAPQKRIQEGESGGLARPEKPAVPTHATPPVAVGGARTFPRNKLAFKNRWLISVDIVAALRRAGVICDIVLPALYQEPSDSTWH